MNWSEIIANAAPVIAAVGASMAAYVVMARALNRAKAARDGLQKELFEEEPKQTSVIQRILEPMGH